MKRIFTFLVSLFAVTFAMGQAPQGVFFKAITAPLIDGVIDPVWADATAYNIEKVVGTETPTIGNPGETTWKGLWTNAGVYILLQVTDDAFLPNYLAPGYVSGKDGFSDWQFDKPEIYFDVNSNLVDGGGPGSAEALKPGHYQVAPGFQLDKNDGTAFTGTDGVVNAFMVDRSHYIAEYFVPYTKILDNGKMEVDKMAEIGFDVTVIDRDPDQTGRNSGVWSNTGSSWSNMDDAGRVTFDGAIALIDIQTLTITGATEITTDNGTAQLSAAVLPVEATQPYKWVLTNGTGMATISTTGLITANRNGTVTVKAVSIDDLVNSNELTISISNQMISEADISIIKNGTFELGADKKENWGGPGVVDTEGFYSVVCVPKVETATIKAEIWDTMFGQKVKVADATTKYFVKFKAKASADMIIPVLFEDRGAGNDNNKVVTTTATYRDNAYGKWDVPVTATEAWYTFDVTFSSIKDNSDYELNFQIGKADGTFSIDNIMMYTEADLALVNSTSSKTIASNQLSVYPNPVINELFVNMTASNVKVAIYNALGQKMMEKVSTGNVVKFDVNSLTKGLYFVRLADGSTQKFIK